MRQYAIGIISMVCGFRKFNIVHVLASISLDNINNLLQPILSPYRLSWIQILDKHLVPILIKHDMVVRTFKPMVLCSENPNVVLYCLVYCLDIIKNCVCQNLILPINIDRIHELST